MDHQSKEVVDKISRELKMQPALKIPRDFMEKMQFVYNVNPEILINQGDSNTKVVTGLSTLFTAPTDRDFFLTSIQLGNQSNVTADNTKATFQLTFASGVQVDIITLSKLTLTVFSESIVLTFPFPIKIAPGTNLVFGSAFTVGASTTSASFTGYTVDRQ